SRQRDDPQRDREQRLHDDSSKEITPNIRKVDEKDVAFRRLDERLSRRLDEHHQISATSDRSQRELLNRDREKDNHYQRDASERLRIESNRRDERTSNIRQKNDAQNDSVFQDNRGRDRESGQRNVQPNVQSELDRTEKRKKDESEVTERKPYMDREQRGDSLQSIQRPPEYRSREKDRDIRQRDEFIAKDNIRVGINRDQERELPNRRDDRTGGLPDLYRPSSEHHLRDIDRRSIREFDRDYRDRDLRGEPIGVDRYRGDYSRDNNQGRDRMIDSHPREVERRLSWELDNRGGTGIFSDKDQMDHRRERERERTREVGHKSRSNSAELKVDSHKHLYDFHQREPERRTTRDVENDQMARTNRTELVRRSESDRHSLFVNDKHHDDFSLDAIQREEQDMEIQSKDLKTEQIILKDDEILPDSWQKCMSRKNKVYYFNQITRESRWTFPSEDFGKRFSNESERSYQISPAHDDKIDEYEQHNSDDIEIPRKKPRLKSRESADEKALDDRKDSSNRDIYERKFGYEDQSSLDNYSVKGTSLRDQKIMADSHADPISRRPRSNTTSNVISSPSSKSQTSPSMTPQFSPTHRSPAPGYDRRYSADYDHLGGSRRVPYSGPQLQSPPMQLRSNAASFNRNDFYERSDNFRIDEFNSRNISGSNNNAGMASPGNAQTNVNNRSNRPTMYNSSFGVDQGSISGNRRTSTMGRGGMSSLNHSIRHRVRSSHEDDRNIYNGDEDRMEASMEVGEFKINNRNLPTREFSNRIGEKADLENGVPPNDSTFDVVPDAAFIASDEEAWRTEDEMVDDVLADTEPESLFLFRRSRSSSPTSHLLSDEDIIRRQIAPIWSHITSNVAGDELFQQFEQIMNNGNSHKKKEMRILNSRKEFDRRRAIFGGKRMFRYKHLFAISRPKTSCQDYFVYPKNMPEVPDNLFQSCIDIF
ncbi:29381_t:CDS:2, partial [Racocetra persica]